MKVEMQVVRINFFFDEGDDGGQMGAVLVDIVLHNGEHVLPDEVEGGEELVGFYGAGGQDAAIRVAHRLFPGAAIC